MQGARDSAQTVPCRLSHAKVPFQYFIATCFGLSFDEGFQLILWK